MKKLVSGIVILQLFFACSPKTGEQIVKNEQPAPQSPIIAHLALEAVQNDQVPVTIDPGKFMTDTVIYRLPKVIPGTYDVSNFGTFISDITGVDYMGNPMQAQRIDSNSWQFTNATQLDEIKYYVNDTFDIENTDKLTPFSPAGTNIDADVFVLNLHGFIGLFDQLKDNEYSVQISAPEDVKRSSALPIVSGKSTKNGIETTTYFAERYFDVMDNPMMFGDLDVEEFQVEDITIVLSVYSPNKVHTAASIKETVATMMRAQKEYLGEMNSTSRYDIFLYLASSAPGEPTGFGALEHHTSTVVVLPEWYPKQSLDESMTDVVSHEFFHIVTPLTVHSEDVHYFDYTNPTFSKHLWMYEGVTEYFASHFQVYEDLQTKPAFYDKLVDKIEYSYTLNDSMSFTTMSENVLDEPYTINYLNVYMKGALIGMTMDIMLRDLSDGRRSMLSLMKELSAKYGMDKPFTDDDLITEIEEMTYPEIGAFLRTHVAGTTPINYQELFECVGLTLGKEQVVTSFFFDGQVPFIDASPSTGEIFFREVEMNSSIKDLGIEQGDVLKSVNGVEYTLDNIAQLIPVSFQWQAETPIQMIVIRDGEEVEISGTIGTPVLEKMKLTETPSATPEQMILRNYWLEKQ
jgi:predicted metalloprotease with PDZ domain